jgi:long-subunit fatty acid transport protein
MLPRADAVITLARGNRWGGRALRIALLVVACPGGARAQVTRPSPAPAPPENLFQDELDLQANSSVVQGSGARAFGMGGAFLARADDATAASWNPAGLSYLRRPELSVVWSATNQLSSVSYDLAGAKVVDDRRRGHGPDFLAATYPIRFERVTGAVQLSFQRVIAFDTSRTIEKLTSPSKQVEASGGFDVLAFGSGLQFSRKLRVGLAVNRWLNGYEQRVEREAGRRATLDADFGLRGWNIHAGMIWTPIESLNVGVVGKTPFTAKVELARSRQDLCIDVVSPEECRGTVYTTNSYSSSDLSLDFPGAFGVGLSWRPRSALTLSADYTRSFWSNGEIHNYFVLKPTRPPDPPPVPTDDPETSFPLLPYPTLNDEQQQDTEQVRIGVEYVVLSERLKLPLRLGAFLDKQYLRAGVIAPPTTPGEPGRLLDGDAPRFKGFTAGAGLIVGPVLLDFAYIYESGDYIDRLEPNRIEVWAHRVYASLIYRHNR